MRRGAPLTHRVDQGGNTVIRTEFGRQYLELSNRLTVAQGAQTEILSSDSTNALAIGENRRRQAAEIVARLLGGVSTG